jgi:hypothetical protein
MVRRFLRPVALIFPLAVASFAAEPAVPQIPGDFPRFLVPGHEKEMESLRRLFWLHYQPAGPLIPLWDEWMPMSALWPAMGSGRELESMRVRWAAALAGRAMNAEGYVHTHQHDGLAHAEGWPFPLWTQMRRAGCGKSARGSTRRRRPAATERTMPIRRAGPFRAATCLAASDWTESSSRASSYRR